VLLGQFLVFPNWVLLIYLMAGMGLPRFRGQVNVFGSLLQS
jgi:hypothetical protein